MKSSRNNKNSVFRNIYEQPYNERTRLKLYNSAKGKSIDDFSFPLKWMVWSAQKLNMGSLTEYLGRPT